MIVHDIETNVPFPATAGVGSAIMELDAGQSRELDDVNVGTVRMVATRRTRATGRKFHVTKLGPRRVRVWCES